MYEEGVLALMGDWDSEFGNSGSGSESLNR